LIDALIRHIFQTNYEETWVIIDKYPY